MGRRIDVSDYATYLKSLRENATVIALAEVPNRDVRL